MTTLKYIAIIVIAVILSVVAVQLLPEKQEEQNFGASTSFSGIAVQDDGFTRGTVLASTTSGTVAILPVTVLRSYQQFTLTPNVASHTLTLPASTTLLNFLPTAGQTATFFIQNGTSTAGVNLTIAAGTGSNLKKATSTLAISPGSVATLQYVRLTNKDFNVLFNISQ